MNTAKLAEYLSEEWEYTVTEKEAQEYMLENGFRTPEEAVKEYEDIKVRPLNPSERFPDPYMTESQTKPMWALDHARMAEWYEKTRHKHDVEGTDPPSNETLVAYRERFEREQAHKGTWGRAQKDHHWDKIHKVRREITPERIGIILLLILLLLGTLAKILS
jgi:hypothetical protein